MPQYQWATRLPRVAGELGIGIGALAVLAWPRLQETFPASLASLPATHPNAALWLILASLALCLLGTPLSTRWGDRLAALLAGGVTLGAGLTTFEHLLGWPAGIDHMLFPLVRLVASVQIPDRPPLATAISFLMIGASLLVRTLAPRQSNRYLPLLLATPTLLALLSIFRHLNHLLSASATAQLGGMSLAIALGLMILAGGIIALHPSCSLMRVLTSTSQDGVLARRLLPASVELPLIIAGAISLGQGLGYIPAQETLALAGICSVLAFLAASWRTIRTIRTLDIARTAAEQTVQHLAAQRKRLLEVAGSLVSATSVDAILAQVQESIGAVVAYDGFGLYWLDTTAELLHPALLVQTAQSTTHIEALALPLSSGIAGHVVRTGNGELLNNAQNDPRSFYPAGTLVTREHLICLPLHANNQMLGVFLMSRHADPPFTTAEFELVQLFIGYASLAISNARLLEQATDAAEHYRTLLVAAERQARELALIGQVRNALARELDLPLMFRTVVEAIASTFGYTHVSVYLLENSVLYLQYQVGYDHVIACIPVTHGVSGRVVRTGQPLLLEEVHSDPSFLGAIGGITSEVCVPLYDHGAVVGTLNVETTEGVRLSTADLQLMLALGEHIGIAIGRARLYTAVRDSEARFATIFRASPVAICISTCAEGRYVDVNTSFLALTGYAREEVIGQTAQDLGIWANPAERKLVAEILQNQGSLQSMELTFRNKIGSLHDLLCSIELIDLDGTPCFLSMMQDLTEHKQAATEREHLITELREALANIRTLRGMLPICASCRKIRDDSGYWSQLETYIQVHADVAFSHGICPDCMQRLYPDIALDPEPNKAGGD